MFLICGEALFDVFVEDGIDAEATTLPFTAKVGGSPFNVAIGLARLGCESALLTGVSTDFLGDRLVAVLASESVSTRWIQRKDAPTTLGFVQKNAEGVPSYAFYGNGAADRSLTPEDIASDLAGVRCLHLGSYSTVTPSTSEALLQLVEREAGNRIISLDPNIRPTVEPDMAIWRERLDRLLNSVDVIKASDEDLASLYPDADYESIVSSWLDRGVKLAVLTRGGDGAMLLSQSAKVEVATPKIKVMDTVGAGDTFQAVLLKHVVELEKNSGDGWHQQLDAGTLTSIGKTAAAAAAITCSRQGADLPGWTDVQQFMVDYD